MKYAILAVLLLNSCTSEIQQPESIYDQITVTRTKSPTLPQKCESFRTEPDPSTWNPVTETYPTNHAWEECMGVGRK